MSENKGFRGFLKNYLYTIFIQFYSFLMWPLCINYRQKTQKDKKKPPVETQQAVNFFILLCKLSEVLDCTNHLRSVGVLVVIPGNNLYLIQSVAEIGNHGLSRIEE